ncbi:MAG: DUF308 domain-containing protein [Drouetiella hepatica Uher 2000/2452]|jgi:uncharacterized membrane protein HdeD (DUF308 family)|uniref:DUF308 domain-containing protein n=1 Tax=Drouetiella hepatica Uher 2000/2452 TaxID=904376 RepID=A0A951QF81_9CYAN|nr:DUF308 domain-containing protein [Drouetiella hepatica Uher 2000/2452]
MTTHISTDDIRKDKGAPLWISVLLIGLGIAAIAAPAVSTIVTETWITLILISAGATKLFYALQTREQDGFIWKLLLSGLYIATGIMLLVNPLSGVITLTLLLGSFLLTEGVFEIILAFRVRPQRNWLSVLVNGVFTLLLGAVIVSEWPGNAPWLLGVAIGASIISTGVSRLMLSLNPRVAEDSTHLSDSPPSEQF